jgi:hypothetical protein
MIRTRNLVITKEILRPRAGRGVVVIWAVAVEIVSAMMLIPKFWAMTSLLLN